MTVTLPDMSLEEYGADILSVQGQRFRQVIEEEGRSTTMLRLFDYLLEHSMQRRAPKEIEIALSVFGRNSEFDPSQDSMVRVQVLRLRNRLNTFFADQPGPRLEIPKGEYRIVLSPDPARVDNESSLVETRDAKRPNGFWRIIAIFVVVNSLVWTVIFFIRHYDGNSTDLSRTSLWQEISANKVPPLIVVGDSYMVIESNNGKDIRRIVMRETIQSSADLDSYRVENPKEAGTLHDLYVHYMPASTAVTLWPVMSLVSTLYPNESILSLLPVSRLSQREHSERDIVYIGRLDELGALRAIVFDASGFKTDKLINTLTDRQSGKVFSASVKEPGENNQMQPSPSEAYDYGYIASFPGSSGKKVIIIAGMQDLALSQMIKIVSDKKQLDVLSLRTNGAPTFEALYEVRSLGTLKYRTNLKIARPIKAEA